MPWIVGGVIVVLLLLYYVPKWQVAGRTFPEDFTEDKRLDLENKLRTTVAQVIGGVLVIIGASVAYGSLQATQSGVAATLQGQDIARNANALTLKGQEIANRNVEAVLAGQQIAREQVALQAKNVEATLRGQELLRESQELARKDQVAERFSRAVAQLGAKESVESRIGGIYSLESIANTSPDYYWQVVEVLAEYIRTRAPLTTPQPEPREMGEPPEMLPKDVGYIRNVSALGRKYPAIRPPADIQAALTVIGRRKWAKRDPGRIDLRKTDLRGADGRGANLAWVLLAQADLTGAVLDNANITGADLGATNLRYASLRNATVREAHLDQTRLHGARLPPDLRMAHLSRTHLEGTTLPVDMTGTQLQYVYLGGVVAGGVNFSFASLEQDYALGRPDLTNSVLWCASVSMWTPDDATKDNYTCARFVSYDTSVPLTIGGKATDCKTFCMNKRKEYALKTPYKPLEYPAWLAMEEQERSPGRWERVYTPVPRPTGTGVSAP